MRSCYDHVDENLLLKKFHFFPTFIGTDINRTMLTHAVDAGKYNICILIESFPNKNLQPKNGHKKVMKKELESRMFLNLIWVSILKITNNRMTLTLHD